MVMTKLSHEPGSAELRAQGILAVIEDHHAAQGAWHGGHASCLELRDFEYVAEEESDQDLGRVVGVSRGFLDFGSNPIDAASFSFRQEADKWRLSKERSWMLGGGVTMVRRAKCLSLSEMGTD